MRWGVTYRAGTTGGPPSVNTITRGDWWCLGYQGLVVPGTSDGTLHLDWVPRDGAPAQSYLVCPH